MKRFVNIALLLCVFISCSNRDLKEYLNQGFATPTFENDVYFSDCAEGEGKKIYVPSGKDVKVRLAITNTYNKELRATLTFPEADAYLFKKVPCITSLDFTSLIISFEFKKDAEPEASNNFLGMSVPIELKLFDVKRGRHLDTRVVKANCNTAPLAIDESAITYDLQEDEYTIHLPKNEGKHNDLKEVLLELSTKQGNGEVKHKVVSIDKAEEQDKDYILKVKDFLVEPSGERKIKVIVYDKAGISSEPKNKNGELIFEDITLLESMISVGFGEAQKEGIPVPEIEELKKYFKNTEDWKNANYEVEYSMPEGTSFVYDKGKNVIKNTTTTTGEHDVGVKLKNPNGMEAIATYKVTITSSSNVELDKSSLKITDKTVYNENLEGVKLLSFDVEAIQFVENLGIYSAEVNVPYTNVATKLNIHIEAGDSLSKVQDLSGDGDSYKKDFNLDLESGENSSVAVELGFKIKAESNSERTYKITFKREAPYIAKIELFHELLSSKNGKAEVKWAYGSALLEDPNDHIEMNVAKNAELTFSITAGEKNRIKECVSNDTEHFISVTGEKETNFSLIAHKNFEIKIIFRAEATLRWENYKSENCGYESGTITYKLNGIDIIKAENMQDEVVVDKGSSAVFEIKNITPGYNVKSWKVGSKLIENPEGIYDLANNKTKLTINGVEKDLVVSVLLEGTNTCTVSWKVEGDGGGIDVTASGNLITSSPHNIEKGGGMTFVPKLNRGYKVKGWKVNNTEYNQATSTSTTGVSISTSWELSLSNIQQDTEVVLLLEKQKYELTVKIENGTGAVKVTKGEHSPTEMSPPTVTTEQTYQDIEYNTQINFEAIIHTDSEYEVEKWTLTKPSGSEIVLSTGSDKGKTSIKMQDHSTVKLYLKKRKQKVKLEWANITEPINQSHVKRIEVTVGSQTLNSSPNGYKSDIPVGTKCILKCNLKSGITCYKVTINGKEPGAGVTVEDNNKKVTINSITEDTRVVFCTKQVGSSGKKVRLSWQVVGNNNAKVSAKIGNNKEGKGSIKSDKDINAYEDVTLRCHSIPKNYIVAKITINGHEELPEDIAKEIKLSNDKKTITIINIQKNVTVVFHLQKKT